MKCSKAITKKVSYRSRCRFSSLSALLFLFPPFSLAVSLYFSPSPFFPLIETLFDEVSSSRDAFSRSLSTAFLKRNYPTPETFIRRCSRNVSGNQNCQSFTELRTETFLFKFPSPGPLILLRERPLCRLGFCLTIPRVSTPFFPPLTSRQLNLHAFSGSFATFDPFHPSLNMDHADPRVTYAATLWYFCLKIRSDRNYSSFLGSGRIRAIWNLLVFSHWCSLKGILTSGACGI